MNKILAEIFSVVFSLFHILALLLIAFVPLGQPGIENVLIRVGLAIAYVLIAGLISTVISMNDHMRDISKKLDKLN